MTSLSGRIGLRSPPCVAIVVALTLVVHVDAAQSLWSGREGQSDCRATSVHYERHTNWRPGQPDLPWVETRSGMPRIIGYLFYYPYFLGDGRFSRAPGLVVPTGGGIPDQVSSKIFWIVGEGAGRSLLIRGERLDAPGSFQSHREPRATGGFPSIVEIPSEGCWRVTLQTGSVRGSIVVNAVDVAEPACDPTPVRRDAIPRTGLAGPWIRATPASAEILGYGSVSVDTGEAAATYVGGRAPDGTRTTITWLARRGAGRFLEIEGSKVAGIGSFHQRRRSTQSVGRFNLMLRVPSPGCWLLRLRTGSVGGMVVFRAVPT